MNLKYNGFSGFNTLNSAYVTFILALWLDNDQELHDMAVEWTKEHSDANELADIIRQYLENEVDGYKLQGVVSNLMESAIAEINFTEVAEHLLDD